MGILVTRETMAAPASASQQSQDLMNQVTRLQDQVKEIQSIVKLQVPSNLKDVSGGAVMDEEVVEGNPYSRLMRLNKTSMVNHYENIQNHSVAIIGLGGIGAVCAEMLSRAGIGKLILFDKKTVAPTDLNRLFYRPEHVGLSKTQATKATLISVNAHVLVETYSLDVTTKDAQDGLLHLHQRLVRLCAVYPRWCHGTGVCIRCGSGAGDCDAIAPYHHIGPRRAPRTERAQALTRVWCRAAVPWGEYSG